MGGGLSVIVAMILEDEVKVVVMIILVVRIIWQ